MPNTPLRWYRQATDRLGMTRREARAVGLLLCVGATGHLLRATAHAPGVPHVAAQLFDPATDGDPLAHRDSIQHLTAPLADGERIDVDHAAVADLVRLSGIGPALAKRIVADRQTNGPFGSVTGLSRVRGLSPSLLERLTPHLSFGGIPAEAHMTSLPDAIDVNLATVADLVGLPGIGPTRARAIVAFRDSVGPFRQIEDLRRVKGITAALLRRLEGRLVVP